MKAQHKDKITTFKRKAGQAKMGLKRQSTRMFRRQSKSSFEFDLAAVVPMRDPVAETKGDPEQSRV